MVLGVRVNEPFRNIAINIKKGRSFQVTTNHISEKLWYLQFKQDFLEAERDDKISKEDDQFMEMVS